MLVADCFYHNGRSESVKALHGYAFEFVQCASGV